MPPKYSEYTADLAKLKAKILAAEAEFTSSMKSNMAGTKYKASYDGLVASFEKLQNSIAVLENPNSAPEAMEQEWNTLSRTLRDSAPDMPTPSEYINGSIAEFNTDIADDNFRRMWRAYSKLTDLSFETSAMESKGGLAQLEQDLNDYDAAKTTYTAAMAKIPEPLEYSGYYTMANLKTEYKAQADENRENYDQMVASNIVENTRIETTKIRVDAIYNIAVKGGELKEVEDQLTGISAELEHVDDQVREDRGNAKEIQADVHDQADRVNEVYAELNRLESAGVQFAVDSTDLQKLNNEYTEELAAKEKFLTDAANATPSLRMKAAEKAKVTLTADFAQRLFKDRRMTDLRDRFNAFTETSGLAKKTPEEQAAFLKQGEAYVKALPKSVVDHYREMNFRPVLDCYDTYLKFQQFKTEFIEIYDVTKAETKADIEDNVKTPASFMRLWTKGSKYVKDGLYEMLEIPDKDPALNGASGAEVRGALKELFDANDLCTMRRAQIAQLAARTENLLIEKEQSEKRREELTEEVKRLEAEAGKHTLESKESTNLEKREDLLAKKVALAEKSNEISNEIKTLQDKKYAAALKYDEVSKKQDDFLENATKFNALYEKTAEDQRKVDAVYDAHIGMKRVHDKIREESGITPANRIGKDYLQEAKQSISNRINRFHQTIECAKKKGHENSKEFKDMQTALDKLYTNDSDLRYRPSVTDYAYQLTQVRNAAQAYLDAKNTEIRLIPSAQRKYRMDYAKRLIEFANNAAEMLGEVGDKVKAGNEHIAAAGIQNLEMTTDRADVYYTINDTVKKAVKVREERAANAEKNRNVEVQQKKEIGNPVKQPVIPG